MTVHDLTEIELNNFWIFHAGECVIGYCILDQLADASKFEGKLDAQLVGISIIPLLFPSPLIFSPQCIQPRCDERIEVDPRLFPYL